MDAYVFIFKKTWILISVAAEAGTKLLESYLAKCLRISLKRSLSQLCATQNFLLRRQSRRKRKCSDFPHSFVCQTEMLETTWRKGERRQPSQGRPSTSTWRVEDGAAAETVEQQEKMLLTQHRGEKQDVKVSTNITRV